MEFKIGDLVTGCKEIHWYKYYIFEVTEVLQDKVGVKMIKKLKEEDEQFNQKYIEDRGIPSNYLKLYYTQDINLFKKGENKTMTKTTKKLRKSDFGIESVIFNDPATIVFFTDGTKFVSKKGTDDVYDPEVGIALAVIHHQSGSKQKFKAFVKKLNK